MELVLDKEVVKEALRELIYEEPTVFKKIVEEIMTEKSEDNTFEKLIQQNFERFHATFKALA